MLKRDVGSYWALLARLHRIGVLYLVVPFSFILVPNLSALASLHSPLSTFYIRIPSFGAPELAAYYLSIPLLFAVLNPSGIVRGLAAAALGLAFASVGINGITGDVRFVFGQPELWYGLPFGPLFSGLLQIPVGAALAYAGYRGRWYIPVRVTVMRRALLLVTGSALMVWAVAQTLFYEENTGLALAVGSAFLYIGLLMQRYRWPRLPLLLGVMGGHVVEENLLLAANVHGLPGTLARPCPITLAVAVLATAGLSYYLRRSSVLPGETRTTGLRLAALQQQRTIVPALGIAAGVAFVWGSLGFEPVETWFLPRVAGLAIAGLCLLELVFSTREQEPQSAAWLVDDAREAKPRSP